MDTKNYHAREAARAILTYVQNTVVDGYSETIARLGLKPGDSHLFMSMTSSDLSQLAQHGHHFLELKIDGEKLRTFLCQTQQHAREQALIRGCILAGATYHFIRSHFGLSTKEIARRKRKLKCLRSDCRRRSATAEETSIIQMLYFSVSDRDRLSVPELFYQIHTQSRADIPVIASVIDEDSGQLKH